MTPISNKEVRTLEIDGKISWGKNKWYSMDKEYFLNESQINNRAVKGIYTKAKNNRPILEAILIN